MPLEDKAARRLVEREISKHPIDASLMTVAVINQVAYLGGKVSRLRGAMGRGVDLKREMQLLCDSIKSLRDINDVVNDVRVVD